MRSKVPPFERGRCFEEEVDAPRFRLGSARAEASAGDGSEAVSADAGFSEPAGSGAGVAAFSSAAGAAALAGSGAFAGAAA